MLMHVIIQLVCLITLAWPHGVMIGREARQYTMVTIGMIGAPNVLTQLTTHSRHMRNSSLTGGEATLYPNASSAALHYLENIGTSFGFDGRQFLSKDSSALDSVMDAFVKHAVDFAATARPSVIYYKPDPPRINAKGNPEGPLDSGGDVDWHSAIGGFWVNGFGIVRCNGRGNKSLDLYMDVSDYYNFHSNGLTAGYGLTDFRMQGLHYKGLAHSYYRYGGSINIHIKNVLAPAYSHIREQIKGSTK